MAIFMGMQKTAMKGYIGDEGSFVVIEIRTAMVVVDEREQYKQWDFNVI